MINSSLIFITSYTTVVEEALSIDLPFKPAALAPPDSVYFITTHGIGVKDEPRLKASS